MTSPLNQVTSNQSILCTKKNNARNGHEYLGQPPKVHQLNPGNETKSNIIKTTSLSAVDVRYLIRSTFASQWGDILMLMKDSKYRSCAASIHPNIVMNTAFILGLNGLQ